MEQAREQEILRITAQFVAEQEAGLRPRLEDYARNYPQYVDEITDFVTYYYAVEVSLPTDTTSVPSLSAGSRAALNLAWERVNTPLPALLDLSADIVEQLVRRKLDPATLPREMLQRLVTVLSQSMSVVRQALGLPDVPLTPAIAETRAPYTLSDQVSFRAALTASAQISSTQKQRWLTLLEHEGL
jgi:hypothetical protein